MSVTLVLRADKGIPLTNNEVDANFSNLKSAVEEYTASDVLIKLKTVDGVGSGLNADLLDAMNAVNVDLTGNSIVSRKNGNFSAGIITATSFVGNLVGSAAAVAFTGLTGPVTIWNQNTTGTAAGLSEVLAVLSGGTGVTTKTGTGSVVLNITPTLTSANLVTALLTTPTLVTPILGTPSSGNFASGTFSWPTFNQNTTGNANHATSATTATALISGNNYQVNSLGVGTPPSGLTGDIRATNNITAYYSDARLKDVQGNIKNPLESVMSLNGVIYKGNDVARGYGYTSDTEQVGLIAQEVQKVLPQVVVPAPFDIAQAEDGSEYSKSGENYLTIQYEKLIPLLIEAIKEQQVQISELKKYINQSN